MEAESSGMTPQWDELPSSISETTLRETLKTMELCTRPRGCSEGVGRERERDKVSEALGLARQGCATSRLESRVLKEKVRSQAMNWLQGLPCRQWESSGMKGTEEEGGPKEKEGQPCQAHGTEKVE